MSKKKREPQSRGPIASAEAKRRRTVGATSPRASGRNTRQPRGFASAPFLRQQASFLRTAESANDGRAKEMAEIFRESRLPHLRNAGGSSLFAGDVYNLLREKCRTHSSNSRRRCERAGKRKIREQSRIHGAPGRAPGAERLASEGRNQTMSHAQTC